MIPADLEFVRIDEIVIGDTLVSFTPVGRDLIEPPTQRRLNRATVNVVTEIDTDERGLVWFNRADGDDAWTSVHDSMVWRIKR